MGKRNAKQVKREEGGLPVGAWADAYEAGPDFFSIGGDDDNFESASPCDVYDQPWSPIDRMGLSTLHLGNGATCSDKEHKENDDTQADVGSKASVAIFECEELEEKAETQKEQSDQEMQNRWRALEAQFHEIEALGQMTCPEEGILSRQYPEALENFEKWAAAT
jgi:hypothetical protein